MRGHKFSLKMILIVSYVVIVLLTLGIFGWRSYTISEKAVVNVAKDNTGKLIAARNEILDMSLQGIQEASLNLLVDEQLYEIFSTLDQRDSVAVIEASKEVKVLLQKYFYSYQQIASVSLITEFYTFGYGSGEVAYDESFFQSETARLVMEREGGLLCVPREGGSFAMMRVANFTLVEEASQMHLLEKLTPPPILVIDFARDVYQKEMQPLLSQEGAKFMILAEDGTIVSHSDQGLAGKKAEETWAAQVLDTKTGVTAAETDGMEMLICHVKSPITGWISAVTIPKDALMKEVLGNLRGDLLLFLFVSILLAGGMSVFLMQWITGALNQLLEVVKRTGEGDFDYRVRNTNIPEFDYLVASFNDMGAKLKKLIDENYVIKIRQQESEIAILTTQLNPHFLHNTLNVIQFSNLNGDQEETGSMIIALSRMLHYTMDNREEMKLLKEDLDWLNQYIYIMKCRYGNEFLITCRVAEELYDKLVPKLFLQPIIENSILHAFKEKESGGVISITGEAAGDNMVFTVEDNGDGMSEEQTAHFFEDSTGSIGIKNVYWRLQLIYGGRSSFVIESRLGEGTKTIITVPMETVRYKS